MDVCFLGQGCLAVRLGVVPVLHLVARPVRHEFGDRGPALPMLLHEQEKTLVFGIIPRLLAPGRHLLGPVLVALLGGAISELLGDDLPANLLGVLLSLDKLL